MNIERICHYLKNILQVPIHEVSISQLTEDTNLSMHAVSVPPICVNEAEDLRRRKVCIRNVENGCYYGVVSDDSDCLYYIGPVQFNQKHIKNADKYGYYCEFRIFVEVILMMREYLTGEEIGIAEFVTASEGEKEYRELLNEQMTRYHFRQQENNWLHTSYEQEKREQSAIKEGNLEKLRDAVNEPLIGKLGSTSENRIRSAKNNAIIVITLSVRSAIEGGLDSETGYQLSDNYISQIERLDDLNKITQFTRRSQEELVRHVLTVKKREENAKSPYIEKCKQYIYKHMHETISIGEIADEIGVTENHLSMVFRRDEGITIKEYILREKIYYAKNLLTYSAYSMNDIARYFGFSSQSHFGNVFRKYIGMTPLEYRKKNRAENFMEGFR